MVIDAAHAEMLAELVKKYDRLVNDIEHCNLDELSKIEGRIARMVSVIFSNSKTRSCAQSTYQSV